MPNPVHIDQIKPYPLALNGHTFSNQLSSVALYIKHPLAAAVRFQRIAQWCPAQYIGHRRNGATWVGDMGLPSGSLIIPFNKLGL